MKNIIQRRLPLNVTYTVTDKKYIPILEGFGCTCSNCGKLIANIATIKNPEGESFDIGFDCLETFLINNNLLSGLDVTDYERVKKMIPKIINTSKKIKEVIELNKVNGVTITGMRFETDNFGDWFNFDWIAKETRPYNSGYKIKDMDLGFLITTLQNIFPNLKIEIKTK